MIEGVLKSAMANAEDQGVRNVGDLIIVDARGDGGPMFKRLMPRARGMAYMVRRRTCHISVGLIRLEDLLGGANGDAAPENENDD
jgi:large subunit ribosomal protein L22